MGTEGSVTEGFLIEDGRSKIWEQKKLKLPSHLGSVYSFFYYSGQPAVASVMRVVLTSTAGGNCFSRTGGLNLGLCAGGLVFALCR